MDRPYVEGVRVVGYRCVKDASFRLTRLHALIGPNDSGKSTLLRALLQSLGTTWWVKGRGWLAGQITEHGQLARLTDHGPTEFPRSVSAGNDYQPALAALAGRAVLRLDPDVLRLDRNLLPADARQWFQDEKGLGLAALYDALLGRDRNRFIEIENRFRELFPTVKALVLENKTSSTKALSVMLDNGTRVPAETMSEGMLYWLAFAIVGSLAPMSMLLIEEPENGLHPARIKEVMAGFRELSQRTQVILATHSPLVINELQPDEVTIVTRTAEAGTKCTPMTETQHFKTRKEVYALGELWLSYADGEQEAHLVGTSAENGTRG